MGKEEQMKKKRIRKGRVITMKRMIKGMVLVALALTVVLGLESRVDAVSYTHLDVYKRQVLEIVQSST